jgi:hypothetical protein
MAYETVPMGDVCDYGYCDDGGDGILGAVRRPRIQRPAQPVVRATPGTAKLWLRVTGYSTPGVPSENMQLVVEGYGRGAQMRIDGLRVPPRFVEAGAASFAYTVPTGKRYKVYVEAICNGRRVVGPARITRVITGETHVNLLAPRCPTRLLKRRSWR